MPKSSNKEIPFNGKWITAEPASIGANFRTLKNMRYTDTHIKGVQGMTYIAQSFMDFTYLNPRSAFHFRKSQPEESHVIVQAYSSAGTASILKDNETAIPTAGAYNSGTLWTDTSAASLGRFSDAPDGQMIYCNSVDTCMWGGNETKIGAAIFITTALSAATDVPASPRDRTDELNNTKTTEAESLGGSYKTFLIGSTRPAKGVKFYLSSVNTSANTLTVKESTDGAWNALTVTSDGTRVTGKSFAQNGTISWASTVATTKPKYLEGLYLYWYQFTVDAATATIYHVTLDLPFQPVLDMWDGVYRDVSKGFSFSTTYSDLTLSILKEDYDSTVSSTYWNASGLVAFSDPDNCLILGFGEKMTGFKFNIPTGYGNTTGSTSMTVDYWNGSAYTNITNIVDGTSEGAISLAKPGVVSWSNTGITEIKKSIDNSAALYYYRVKWDKTLSGSVRIDYVGGISASKPISYYKFPVFAQGRVLLCCDMAGEKNKAVSSSKYMPQVYNGDDSVDIYFGEEGELTAGTELFSQFGSSLYSLVLMFKDYETWVMAGQDIKQWADNTFLLSSSIGCPAPLTLKTINLHAEPGQGVNRALAIWQGANGVYMSDGRAPIPIHGDIKAYFDDTDDRCIKSSYVGNSVGFVDEKRQEYHLLIASGTSATGLNTELVYDIARNKWFEIDRGDDLVCGVAVHDSDGNSYAYGLMDNSHTQRLEYGTDFDGTDITHTVQFGDLPLGGLATETRLDWLRLITVAKTTTTNDITCTHYADTATSGTTKTMDPANSGYRIAEPDFDDKLNGDPFHSFKFEMTTDNESIGFEPLALVVAFHPMGQDG